MQPSPDRRPEPPLGAAPVAFVPGGRADTVSETSPHRCTCDSTVVPAPDWRDGRLG
ncbi:hypothetical protein [Streptomyces luteogriseus]|uniref:hypothetical protein n=1 Tax=Streptomyces luteogriseus TaxID=68233 RepID=UPI002E35D5AF|nr:hypothetical protein [Streptomyces luteogriseus]WTJ25876.1 hypothetical protein OID52_01785 [Streptomyces luteogriseus]